MRRTPTAAARALRAQDAGYGQIRGAPPRSTPTTVPILANDTTEVNAIENRAGKRPDMKTRAA